MWLEYFFTWDLWLPVGLVGQKRMGKAIAYVSDTPMQSVSIEAGHGELQRFWKLAAERGLRQRRKWT
jgi:hypothetical protein